MRALDRLLALLGGLALAGLGALVAIEAGLRAADRDALVIPRRRWDRSLSDLEWTSSTLELVAIITIAAGAILLLLQVAPRRPRRLALESIDGRAAWITPAGVRRVVERAVLDAHDDVADARAQVQRRRVRVKATVVASADDGAPSRIGPTVAAALDALEVERNLRVRVRIDRNQDRVR
ncbi:MAG: DUF6286 domain-containing protein [Iamia sp.]